MVLLFNKIHILNAYGTLPVFGISLPLHLLLLACICYCCFYTNKKKEGKYDDFPAGTECQMHEMQLWKKNENNNKKAEKDRDKVTKKTIRGKRRKKRERRYKDQTQPKGKIMRS